jgi:hypothetical protein
MCVHTRLQANNHATNCAKLSHWLTPKFLCTIHVCTPYTQGLIMTSSPSACTDVNTSLGSRNCVRRCTERGRPWASPMCTHVHRLPLLSSQPKPTRTFDLVTRVHTRSYLIFPFLSKLFHASNISLTGIYMRASYTRAYTVHMPKVVDRYKGVHAKFVINFEGF